MPMSVRSRGPPLSSPEGLASISSAPSVAMAPAIDSTRRTFQSQPGRGETRGVWAKRGWIKRLI